MTIYFTNVGKIEIGGKGVNWTHTKTKTNFGADSTPENTIENIGLQKKRKSEKEKVWLRARKIEDTIKVKINQKGATKKCQEKQKLYKKSMDQIWRIGSN